MTEREDSPSILVRPAGSDDLPAIGDLWQEMIDFHVARDKRLMVRPTARESFLRYVRNTLMRSPSSFIAVAVSQGRVVGFLAGRIENTEPVYVISDFGHITDISVTESARRHGVGRALFRFAEQWFKTRGMSTIRLSVAVTNPVSRAFWKEIGFQPFFERYWYDIDNEGT